MWKSLNSRTLTGSHNEIGDNIVLCSYLVHKLTLQLCPGSKFSFIADLINKGKMSQMYCRLERRVYIGCFNPHQGLRTYSITRGAKNILNREKGAAGPIRPAWSKWPWFHRSLIKSQILVSLESQRFQGGKKRWDKIRLPVKWAKYVLQLL